jgi:hypothetical protein
MPLVIATWLPAGRVERDQHLPRSRRRGHPCLLPPPSWNSFDGNEVTAGGLAAAVASVIVQLPAALRPREAGAWNTPALTVCGVSAPHRSVCENGLGQAVGAERLERGCVHWSGAWRVHAWSRTSGEHVPPRRGSPSGRLPHAGGGRHAEGRADHAVVEQGSGPTPCARPIRSLWRR